MRILLSVCAWGAIVGTLVGCAGTGPQRASPPSAQPPVVSGSAPEPDRRAAPVQPAPAEPRVSMMLPVPWSDLPGWEQASLDPVWQALLRNCERPTEAVVSLCPDVRRLAIADDAVRRTWMQTQLRPFRLQSESGLTEGLLTAYYEPVFDASRTRKPGFEVPLYYPPADLASGPKRNLPWFTREEIDTREDVRAKLRPLAWLANPVDALVLHIQGSGRLRLTSEAGVVTEVGVRYAASNNQPYRSVGRALLDARELTDASWPGIQNWLTRNPTRVNATLWTNPRYVFFVESPILEPEMGPPGAQGVLLTPMRSIAVDPRAVGYGSLMWMHTRGPQLQLSQLVLAQDTGSAIVGAVRADLFAGTGQPAGDLAGRVRQPLWLWVLRPR